MAVLFFETGLHRFERDPHTHTHTQISDPVVYNYLNSRVAKETVL